MNRYTLAAFFLALTSLPAIAQVPISGAVPPWVERFKLTDQAFVTLKNKGVPEAILVKLIPLKDKELLQEGMVLEISRLLTVNETNKYQRDILGITPWTAPVWTAPVPNSPPNLPPHFIQSPSPAMIQVPSGKPLEGFYKMEAVLVGANGWFPFDSGEYNLAGFGGNARIYGSFYITLPPSGDADARNNPVPYRTFRGICCGCR